MTNIPFSAEEAQHWTGPSPPPIPACLKPALRIDPLLAGDWRGVCTVLGGGLYATWDDKDERKRVARLDRSEAGRFDPFYRRL